MFHIPLVRSSLIAAMGTVGLASLAGAATTTFTDEALFVGAASGAGLAQAYVEDFESYTIPYGYGYLTETPPWTSTAVPSLSIDSNGFGLFLTKGMYFFPSLPTTTMGGNAYDTLTVQFAGGVPAAGMDLFGVGGFVNNYFDTINYVVYDTGGGVLDVGSFAADGALGGYIGVVSDDLIGSISVSGGAFGGALGAPVYLDNISGWVPTPGAGAVLAFGGLAAIRRRR